MPTYDFLPTRNVFGMDASQEAGELIGSLTLPHRHQGADHRGVPPGL